MLLIQLATTNVYFPKYENTVLTTNRNSTSFLTPKNRSVSHYREINNEQQLMGDIYVKAIDCRMWKQVVRGKTP